MARQSLGLGAVRHGSISARPNRRRDGFIAQCRVNGGKGTQVVTAQGESELEAKEALLTKLDTWVPPKKRRAVMVGPDGEILGPEVEVDIEANVASTTLGEATRL